MNAPVNLSFDAHKAAMSDVLRRQKAAHLRDGAPSAEKRIDWLNRSIDPAGRPPGADRQGGLTKISARARPRGHGPLTDVAGSIGPLKFAPPRTWPNG